MKVWVVTKSLVDLPGTQEFIGVFTTVGQVNDAVLGAGTYTIAEMELDRRYAGDLLDVRVIVKLTERSST
jgi:hypothetical protein